MPALDVSFTVWLNDFQRNKDTKRVTHRVPSYGSQSQVSRRVIFDKTQIFGQNGGAKII